MKHQPKNIACYLVVITPDNMSSIPTGGISKTWRLKSFDGDLLDKKSAALFASLRTWQNRISQGRLQNSLMHRVADIQDFSAAI